MNTNAIQTQTPDTQNKTHTTHNAERRTQTVQNAAEERTKVCCIYDGQKAGRDHGINSVFIDANKKHIKKCERVLHLSFCQD